MLIAGIDEAGRGPLAGPVVAAAVILNEPNTIEGLNDSKKLSEKKREKLFIEIYQHAQAVGVGQASVEEVDELNIFQATFLAMQRAVENLAITPDQTLVDGKFAPKLAMACKPIIGGDALEPSISAASIIAKVTRDRLMVELDAEFPKYGFAKHKGYGTAMHMENLKTFGACSVHRRSFAPVRKALIANRYTPA